MINTIKNFKFTKRENDSLWKTIWRYMFPPLIMSLFTGIYVFFDDVLSVRLTSSEMPILYDIKSHVVTQQFLVRYSLLVTMGINFLLASFTTLFVVGISSSIAPDIENGNFDKAEGKIKKTIFVAFIAALIIVPVFIAIAKPLMNAQFNQDPLIKEVVIEHAFKYIWVTIIGFPFLMYAQIIVSIYRVHGVNFWPVMISVFPIFINLFLDWFIPTVFKTGLQGSAIATLISYLITALSIIVYQMKSKHEFLRIRKLFGDTKVKWSTICLLIIIGLSSAMREFIQGWSEIYENRQLSILDSTTHNFLDQNLYVKNISNVIPIINIFIPMIFAIVIGAAPILSIYYNNDKYTKQKRKATLIVFIYAMIIGVFCYVASASLFKFLCKIMFVNNSWYDIVSVGNIMTSLIMMQCLFLPITMVISAIFIAKKRYVLSILVALSKTLILWIFLNMLLKITMNDRSELITPEQINKLFTIEGMGISTYIYFWSYPIAALISAIFSISLTPLLKVNNKKLWNKIKSLIIKKKINN